VRGREEERGDRGKVTHNHERGERERVIREITVKIEFLLRDKCAMNDNTRLSLRRG
jgi:hypothetical protein